MKYPFLLVLCSFATIGACSSAATPRTSLPEDAGPPQDGSAGPPGVGSDADRPIDLDASALDSNADAGLRVPDGGIELSDAGCVTWNTAATYCSRTGPLCAFSAACGNSPSADQCSINCTMQTLMNCFSPKDMTCLLDATEANSCSALSACKWRL